MESLRRISRVVSRNLSERPSRRNSIELTKTDEKFLYGNKLTLPQKL